MEKCAQCGRPGRIEVIRNGQLRLVCSIACSKKLFAPVTQKLAAPAQNDRALDALLREFGIV